ncbi:hypothetical protein [Thalassobaculum salexigens]|uniref:hypothetical protein n=1 Tax=Thalassobaculum salexigens TaxID=455360 RepID=UPI00040B46CA|nr:hypothetical protein [Thalassobaculum salexigens]
MLLDAANRSGAWVRGEHLDQVNASLRALAEAAVRAEGAFARLVAQVATPAALPETGCALQGLVDDVVRGIGFAGDRLSEGILRGNERAADRSVAVWDRFGDRMIRMFGNLFEQVARDGEISFSSLFRSIVPIATAVFRQLGVLGGGGGLGFDLSGLLGGSGGGPSLGSLLGAGSSLIGLATGGGPFGGIFGGTFGGSLGVLGAASPYIAGALTLAQVLGPALFAPSPSVGPTTVARVSPDTGEAVYSADNGGDPSALVDTVDAIFAGIERVQSRFGGVLNGNGFDIGYFPNPEDGSGQTGGYNFKAIIGAQAEDADRFRGLTEAELVAEAVKFIVREGLEGIDAPDVAEAAKHSVADSLEALFDDLIFAERFGALRDALSEAGDGVDAYTVALQRQRLGIQETGRTLATDGVEAIRTFLDRAMSLFPGEEALSSQDGSAGDDGVGIGAPVPDAGTTLLYEQDEGSPRFQPGVTGVYDETENTLVGLGVAGRTLTFAGGERTDEGRPYGDQTLSDGMIEVVGGAVSIADEALRDLVATASDLGQAVERTTERSQAYLDNQQRVRDAFAIAAADVDGLIETIAGGFELETIGPFEERLIAGTAAIGQLQGELERINEDIAEATRVFPDLGVAAIDVAEKVAEATALLTAQLRSDYTDQVARELREARGLGAVDGVAVLSREYQDRRADGEAIGITDFSELEALYRERLLALLDGSDDLAGVLDQLGASFSDLQASGSLLPEVLAELSDSFTEELERDARSAAGLGIVDGVADRLTEYDDRRSVGEAMGLTDLSDLDAVLRDQLSDLFSPDVLDLDAIEAVRTAFADNTLVMEVLTDALEQSREAANDNVTTQFSVADATRLANRELAAQIDEQERLALTAERVIDSIADTRRRITLDPNLSTLSPQQQLDEARSFFETLAARAAEGDQEAQFDLGGAAEDYLRLARDFYASNEDYARIFATVDGALGETRNVAERQLDVAQAQLEELRTIARGFSGDLGGLPNPNANFGQAPTRNRIIAQLTGYAGDFGSGQFGAFRAGLSDEINRIVDLLDQTIPFAAGGIMTARGSLPLTRYAVGGVADSPQLALFGEGRLPEAFVPLPDGRSIPVTIAAPANDRPAVAGGEDGIADLISETRRMTAAVTAMRADNAALRRGLERVVAASRGPGRAA